MKQIISYIKDKWWWLQTFNKKPEIEMNGTVILVANNPKNIDIKGRLTLTVSKDSNWIVVDSIDEITPELINKIKHYIKTKQ